MSAKKEFPLLYWYWYAVKRSRLPEWSTLKEYKHHYRLTVSCYIPATETGKWIEVGNTAEIIGRNFFY